MILCREYGARVNGRDYYDYLFFIGKVSKFNLPYLENKLENTGGILRDDETLTLAKAKELLKARFQTIDYESVKKDVSPFIENEESLSIWKEELFLSTLDHLQAI